MFPSVMFGRYAIDELEPNKNSSFVLQTREEGLRITNELSRLTLPKERNVDYQVISGLENVTVKTDIL